MTAPISVLLREATRDSHAAAERTGFFRALAEGALPRQSAVSYLRGLAIVHAVLERSLALCAVPWRWDADLARLPALLADLDACGAAAMPDINAAIDAAITLGDDILLDAGRPARLAGRVYVLEGSLLGGQIVKGLFASALGAPDRELAYFSPGPAGLGARWKRVKARLDTLAPDDLDAATEAARSTFDGVAGIAAACHPFEASKLQRRVTALNPEAGRHAMPQDEGEIGLALRCADAVWRRHTYLEARYGARGRRFTLSDGCWLASLRGAPPDALQRNLHWLAGVLAVRGLPTLLLERHLEAIDQAFGGAEFSAVVGELRGRRSEVLPEADVARLVERWRERLPDHDAVELLVAALADEAAGATGAWESTRGWFANPERFPSGWVEAVEALAAEARAALRSG